MTQRKLANAVWMSETLPHRHKEKEERRHTEGV